MRKLFVGVWIGAFAGLLLAGCNLGGGTDPLNEALAAEDAVYGAVLAWVEGVEASAQGLTPQGDGGRPLTLVKDSDGLTVLAQATGWTPPQDPGGLLGQPLGITIKCSSDGRRCAYAPMELVGDGEGGYRMVWRGRTGEGTPIEEATPATAEPGGPGTDPTAKPRWSYNKIGLGGFWADSLILYPFRLHLAAPGPEGLAGWAGPTPPQNPTASLEEALRQAFSLPKPFSLSWPPALLLREDLVLAFAPYQNPAFSTARSPADLVGQPLGVAYWRGGKGAKLTKADAARLLSLSLTQEPGGGYGLEAQDLRNPGQVLRFRVGEVGWCDGCFGQDPRPRYLGIEDRLQGPPLVHLQVGGLLLRGIEKKDR